MKKMQVMLLMALMIWGAAEANAHVRVDMKRAFGTELHAKSKSDKEKAPKYEERNHPKAYANHKMVRPGHHASKGKHPGHPAMRHGAAPCSPHHHFHHGGSPKQACCKEISHNKRCCKSAHKCKKCCHGHKHGHGPRR